MKMVGKKHRSLAVSIVEDCPPFPVRRTRNGECQYPFERLLPGMGLDVTGRHLSTVREALKHWRKTHGEGMVFTVRQIETNKVRVRRDK